MTEPGKDKAEPPSRAKVVGKLVARLCDEHFGTGPLAELRRLDPEGPLGAPALHRLLAREVPDAWLGRDAAGRDVGVRDWALVIHGLALAAPDNLRGEQRLGAALQAAGFAEGRFVNLLDADPDELRVRLPRAVRFLVHRGGRLHGPQMADLVLTPRASDDYDALRRRIATDYYRAERQAAKDREAAGDPAAT